MNVIVKRFKALHFLNMKKKCCVRSCARDNKEGGENKLQFFKFPSDEVH